MCSWWKMFIKKYLSHLPTQSTYREPIGTNCNCNHYQTFYYLSSPTSVSLLHQEKICNFNSLIEEALYQSFTQRTREHWKSSHRVWTYKRSLLFLANSKMTGSGETVTKISCLTMAPSNIPKSRRSSDGQDNGKDWYKGWNSTMCWRIAAVRGCLSLVALVFIMWYRSALDSQQGSVAYGQPEWAIEPWQLVGGSRIQLAALTGE